MNIPRFAKRVLICDDDETSRFKLSGKLKKLGYDVVGEAQTGLQAMNQFVELNPDLVLLDINMPIGTGLTVLSFIREIDQLARIVIITGKAQNQTSDVIIKALKAGANDYLAKGNYDENRLKKAIAHVGFEPESANEDDVRALVELVNEPHEEKSDAEKQDESSEKSDDPASSVRRMARSIKRR